MPFKDHEPTELKVDIATLSMASGSSALRRHTSVGSAGLGPWSSVYRTSGGSMIFTIPRNCTVHCTSFTISYCKIRFTTSVISNFTLSSVSSFDSQSDSLPDWFALKLLVYDLYKVQNTQNYHPEHFHQV